MNRGLWPRPARSLTRSDRGDGEPGGRRAAGPHPRAGRVRGRRTGCPILVRTRATAPCASASPARGDWMPGRVDCSDPYALLDRRPRPSVGFVTGPGPASAGLPAERAAPADSVLLRAGARSAVRCPSAAAGCTCTDTATSVMAHEFGHNFGLGHSVRAAVRPDRWRPGAAGPRPTATTTTSWATPGARSGHSTWPRPAYPRAGAWAGVDLSEASTVTLARCAANRSWPGAREARQIYWWSPDGRRAAWLATGRLEARRPASSLTRVRPTHPSCGRRRRRGRHGTATTRRPCRSAPRSADPVTSGSPGLGGPASAHPRRVGRGWHGPGRFTAYGVSRSGPTVSVHGWAIDLNTPVRTLDVRGHRRRPRLRRRRRSIAGRHRPRVPGGGRPRHGYLRFSVTGHARQPHRLRTGIGLERVGQHGAGLPRSSRTSPRRRSAPSTRSRWPGRTLTRGGLGPRPRHPDGRPLQVHVVPRRPGRRSGREPSPRGRRPGLSHGGSAHGFTCRRPR